MLRSSSTSAITWLIRAFRRPFLRQRLTQPLETAQGEGENRLPYAILTGQGFQGYRLDLYWCGGSQVVAAALIF
jgi:hypothetical protein